MTYPVEFVGAGPGAADLLTLRAARLLHTAGVVLYPGTYLNPEVLQNCSAGADLVDTQHLDLDAIVARIVEAQQAGLRVVRLVSGDPSVYSAVFEQTRRLDFAGVAWAITPGVPAYAAAAARVGHELTVPLVTQSVVLTRAQQRSTVMPASESLAAFAATRATLVLHLAITRIRALAAELESSYGAECPVVVVYRASQPGEQVLRGTLSTIADQVESADFRQAAVILVGHALAARTVCAGGESHLYDPWRNRAAVATEGLR